MFCGVCYTCPLKLTKETGAWSSSSALSWSCLYSPPPKKRYEHVALTKSKHVFWLGFFVAVLHLPDASLEISRMNCIKLTHNSWKSFLTTSWFNIFVSWKNRWKSSHHPHSPKNLNKLKYSQELGPNSTSQVSARPHGVHQYHQIRSICFPGMAVKIATIKNKLKERAWNYRHF